MPSTAYALLSALILIGCTPRESAPPPAPVAAPPVTAAPAVPPAATMPPAAGAIPAPAAGQPALATQESNWAGVVVDVVEFRRRGNTLTAKLRVTNRGTADVEPDIHYSEAYIMDAAAGKKYEVLKDEKGNYIAALRSGYNNRWYQNLNPAQSVTIWMKFPAPPADVKAVTLQVPGVPPFEDLAIQDS
jgi:hypothetical protein